jgi:two-component system chemotaxis response regulator CheY
MPMLSSTRKPKILLVDDERDVREVLSLLLAIEGFVTLTAENGLYALNQLKRENDVSLILLDLHMPVMDGWEFLRRKTEMATAADIPVIVATAVAPSGSLDGAQTVLRKPVNPRSLIETIKRHVR